MFYSVTPHRTNSVQRLFLTQQRVSSWVPNNIARGQLLTQVLRTDWKLIV